MPGDDTITLRDIAMRLDGVADRLAGLEGSVTTAIANQSQVLGELRHEIQALRADRDDDRKRLGQVEGDVRGLQGDVRELQRERDEKVQGRWWSWSYWMQWVIALVGWVVAMLHPFGPKGR
jgi:hypothetical protein